MPDTIKTDSKHRIRITALHPGDVLQIEQESPDVFVLRRIRPPEQRKPRIIQIKGELFGVGGRAGYNRRRKKDAGG